MSLYVHDKIVMDSPRYLFLMLHRLQLSPGRFEKHGLPQLRFNRRMDKMNRCPGP